MFKPVRITLSEGKYREKIDISSTTSSPRENSKRSSKEFTVDDVISICSDIARKDGITVKLPTSKTNILRRFSADLTKRSFRKGKLNNSNSGYVCKSAEGSPLIYARSMSNIYPTRANDSIATENIGGEKSDKENIPGLCGRDVVAIAILVDSHGTPMKTYTERESIPSEEYDAAEQVFISRVPFPEEGPKTPPTSNNRLNVQTSDDNVLSSVKLLSDFLTIDMDVTKGNKLKKHMSTVLHKLHTADLSTARSFLKATRYANVRNEIKTELLDFVEKELKMTILSDNS